MGERIKVNVKNTSERAVYRGGRVFPPLKTTEVLVSKIRLKEIKAHANLIVEPESKPKTYPCPYCDDYVGKNKAGLTQHVRMSHEELYEEYRRSETYEIL